MEWLVHCFFEDVNERDVTFSIKKKIENFGSAQFEQIGTNHYYF